MSTTLKLSAVLSFFALGIVTVETNASDVIKQAATCCCGVACPCEICNCTPDGCTDCECVGCACDEACGCDVDCGQDASCYLPTAATVAQASATGCCGADCDCETCVCDSQCTTACDCNGCDC